MNYNKITSVEVFNFMVYEHAIIHFDDCNIINIKGYNSGGKSTMLKAIAVCLMNMYPKAQTKFIRHGEKYFRIVVRFEDGMSIVRDKYITGQSLYEMYRDDKCIFTTKEGNKLTKISEIPQVIQKYLGLCETSSGYLNYQVRQDPLWLIETTGSENYNSLNEILKTEELSRANALLNSDKNQLNSEITGIEASLQEVNSALIESKGYTDELLSLLEGKESECKSLSRKYRDVKGLIKILSELEGIKNIPSVSEIECTRLEAISSIQERVSTLNNMVDLPAVEKCNTDKMIGISKITDIVSRLETMGKSYPEVLFVDVDRIACMERILSIVKELKANQTAMRKLSAENTKVRKELDTLVHTAKAMGIKFVQCENCGTYIEVSTTG